MTDQVASPTYEEMVLAQVQQLSVGFVEGYNPVEFPISSKFDRERESDRRLWELPFAEKPVQPAPENMHTFAVTDEPTLITLCVPRQYASVEVEREVVPVGEGFETLVERVFYRFTQAMGGEREFVAASAIFHERVFGEVRLKIQSQTPARTGIASGGDMPEADGKNPRDYLREPLTPFVAPFIVEHDGDE